MIAINKKDEKTSIANICKCFSIKRDTFYKYKSRSKKKQLFEHKVVEIVKQRRKTLPREGVRKLIKSLNTEFERANVKVGIDTLFSILRKHQMLTLRKKYSARTTNSLHRFYKYKNIIQDIDIKRPNQVWVSDITYIRTVKGFCYLALITDMYSRKIVGV